MLNWLLFLALGVIAVYAIDCAWLRQVERIGRQPLHDPDGYLELTARMTELCHGDRNRVDELIAEQKRLHPQLPHVEAVRLAMRRLLEPETAKRR